MASRFLKVSELARRTGLTVRALHHYDEIGLLRPTRSAAGHRLYTRADLQRLLRIRALQQTGLALEEIRACLDDPDYELLAVLEMRVARLRAHIERDQRLCSRLEHLAERLREHGSASVGELMTTLEEIHMFEKYYTPEQREQLEARKRAVGAERIREVEAAWPRLIAAVRAEMDKGTSPQDPVVQALARRWQELVAEFTGGDRELARSAGRLLRDEPSAREHTGLDAAIMAFVAEACG